MLRKLATGAAFTAVLALSGAAQAQSTPLRDQVATFVQPTDLARFEALTALLDRHGLAYEVQTFAGERNGQPLEGRNVIVTLGDGERDLLLTAHYDAEMLGDGSLVEGVIDNAASAVIIAEVARRLADEDLNHRLVVIFFDQEELGLVGAQRWVEANGTGRIAAVVNSDVAAFGDTMMYSEHAREGFAPVMRAVRTVCAERTMSCLGYPVYPPSDDRVFTAAGVPNVSVGFQSRVGAHQMWLAINAGAASGLAEGFLPEVFTLIHSPNDNMSRVEEATLALGADTYEAIVRELDETL
ncbi:M28 family peptidase [Brevundimonas sp.]|uniref:M28 family metallopeptidase n=1 Tax=Brevundimonas sp. TaxID=1871086 RepID=UPI0025E23C8B|nr:M28 family peptidase [Brevundimonas sp.]